MRRPFFRTALALAFVAGLSVAPALAQEVRQPNPETVVQTEPHEAGHESGGMPQLKTETYSSQVFWLVVAFAVLYWLNSRVGLPAVGAVLEARRERIDGDLDQAAALKTQAEQVKAEYEKALAAADAESKRALAEATEAVKAQTAQRQAELTTQLDARMREAEQSIAQAKQQALASVRDVAAEITAAAAAKVGGVQLDPQTAANAVDATMRERVGNA